MQTISRFVAILAIAAAAGCGGALAGVPQLPPTAHLNDRGVMPRAQAVESGTVLRFVNDDVRQHEIFSNDCRELDSTPLAPGEAFVALLDLGPKVCHFQDLLAPGASEYWGTVRVAEPPIPSDTISGG
jgi:hypothetical protein